jgi:hypothetical protein
LKTRSLNLIGLGAAWAALALSSSRVRADAIQNSGTNAPAQGPGVLWYGGDYAGGPQTNNTMLTDQYGSSVLGDFVVDDSSGWHVTGLFSNDIKGYPPAPPATLPAVWSIRTGAGPGDSGQVLAGGVADALVTPTGRANEYQIAVSGLSLDLKPGVYFLQVSPISPTAGLMDFYVGASGGQDALGTRGPGSLSVWHFASDGPSEDVIAGYSSLRPSMGVVGETIVPEPSTWAVLGLALGAAAARTSWARALKVRSGRPGIG